MTHVRYLPGAQPHGFVSRVEQAAVDIGASSVADLGGGANPMLPREFVAGRALRYVVIDVSEVELAKAPDWCEKVVADLTSPGNHLTGTFDLVISKWLLEHVTDPHRFHLSVRRLLRPGGKAIHFFPTLYALPFLFNRVTPERLSERLLARMMPGREPEGHRSKFPAYYRWCRGPSRKQIGRFRDLGYDVDEYAGYFGHVYFERFRPLHAIEIRLARTLLRHPLPVFTSFAHVVLSNRAASAHEPDQQTDAARQSSPSRQ